MPQLTWLGDAEAKRAARRVPYRLLETQSVHGDPDADNWLIQGDNLEALKSLLPFCAGRVKCIFIDPPYNTKSAFEHYDDNLEHSQWLSMMYPRLELLRDLLAEDGSIWVTIDDNEGHYLKVVMDDVFGRGNFIATGIWQKLHARNNSAQHLSDDHDFIIAFARNLKIWRPNKVSRSYASDADFWNPDDDPRGLWRRSDLTAAKPYSDGHYEVTGPHGDIFVPRKNRYWSLSRETFAALEKDDRIWWGKTGRTFPFRKRFQSELGDLVPTTVWLNTDVGNNREAKQEVAKLFGRDDIFSTPKPERLARHVLHIATNPGDLVLDSFLGSATTAAVAHKMGRRWIGIEMGEHARTHCLPRLLKVIDGEPGGISKAVDWNGGGGFRFLTLGPPVFEPDGRINPAVRFPTLAGYLWFLETGTPWTTHDATPSPLLGLHDDTAVVLLYNGILGDSRTDGGNVLTSALWRDLEPLAAGRARRWIIYGEAALMPETRRRELNIQFKQIPYDIQMR
ncbi:site-specific DNA-methyltransferase [Allochromatium humboldtianum]|uniref:site-specific DNA-methyltransferase (adenine-specific) n=1 Tax=Allochromatium humboldtianum TaxID=504901 RepID=A0A850R9F9_9GAMM|nr:site-specific DNA-methyltransferase [Allochromatium humboldtianum]NVZ07837.1 site-specific DNA-methyltransferase [Allochromatium humboldtianum]